MPDTPRPIYRRTPDKLHVGDVVRFTGFAHSEVVQRVHPLRNGSFLVRTSRNLHYCHGDLLVELVIATWVPGVGFVAPAAEVDA